MLTTTVEVQRAQTIRAGAGQAWLLLASPAAAQLTAWLRECKAVLEGSRPWPDGGLPAGVREACTRRRVLEAAVSFTAATLIAAPSAHVWQALWARHRARRPSQSSRRPAERG